MRAFITGGAGFIGSHLADALIARGDSVTILDNMRTSFVVDFAPYGAVASQNSTTREDG